MNDFARRSLGLIRAALIVLLVALIAGPGYGEVPGPDAWENSPPDGLQSCNVIDSALIAPVPVAHRPEAIAKLEDVAIAELDQGQALAILDRPSDASISAASRIKAAIAKLEEERRSALEDRVGSWNRAAQQRLDGLHRLDADPATAALRPLLVRAVAKNEGTGGFFASACEDGLVIRHGSFGPSVPPSKRLPIVVFLDRAPAHVFIDWVMAR
jgi:hypothetical protein